MTRSSVDSATRDDDSGRNDPWLDRIIDGRYRVLERVGRGGMGVVYRVEHTRMGKIAAMKVLHPSLVADRSLIRRFQAEAEAISKLNHPNIVQVFDFGRTEDTVFLVMEYLRGEDLAAILRRDGPLDTRRCASIIVQVCDALAEAHDFGIIHRDLKPENIRVSRTKDGQDFVKVLDFGLAKMVEGEHQAAITAQNNLVGTPYYMAPEQIRGEDLDIRVDVYSLGAMLYRMLTGEHAFAAKTPMGVLTKHLTDEVAPPSTRRPEARIVEAVDAVVVRAMSKQAGDRFGDVLELKRELIAALTGIGSAEVMQLSPRDSGSSYDALTPPSGSGRPGVSEKRADQRIRPSSETRRASDNNRVRSDTSERSDTELGLMATGPIVVDEPTSGERLRREDLAFERRLRRGKLFKLMLLLPLLGGGAFAAYWFGFRAPPQIAPQVEHEPNNQLQKATLLANGQAVRGQVGKRVSSTESDRDWYKLVVPGDKPQQLALEVTGIPNMDVKIELFDALGGRITDADSTGVGGPERITNWQLKPGTYYVLVRENWRMGRPPTENVTDWYRLTPKLVAVTPGWEREPNDDRAQARALKVGDNVRGYIGKLGDQDVFTVTGTGKLSAKVAAKGVDLVLEVTGADGKTRRVDAGGKGAAEKISGVALAPSKPAIIVVRGKVDKKPIAGHEQPSLTSPYTLELSAQ